jgi:hypothetical protein
LYCIKNKTKQSHLKAIKRKKAAKSCQKKLTKKLSGHVWACLGMLKHAWACVGVFEHSWECISVLGHVIIVQRETCKRKEIKKLGKKLLDQLWDIDKILKPML